MSDEYLELSTGLVSEAVTAVVPYLARSRTDRTNSFETYDFSRKFIEALVEELEAGDLFCDHSVGICTCSEQQTVAELKLALDGKKPCHDCGGEGFVYNKSRIALEASRSLERGSYFDPEQFTETCRRCSGSGTVPLTDVK